MKRWYYPALALLLGLFTAQVIATTQVSLSNTELYHTLLTIKDAGYFPIPNERTMPRLREFGPAFFGGLFFTLSVGAGLSLLALAAAWIWDRLLHRKISLLILYVILALGFLLVVNYQGLCPMVTLYFLVIPPVVFVVTLRWMPPRAKKKVWLNRMVHAVPVCLLAILWTPQMDSHLFLELRDKLLLSNPVGIKINDFYYDYTLYPAEVFKSLDQKMLKTCNLEGIQKKPVALALERELRNRDYLNVGGVGDVDLRIVEAADNLVFENRGRTILRTTLKDFLSGPGTVLKGFSLRSDRYAFFRQFTFFSLLIGFPITLYIFLYTLLRLALGSFLDLKISSATASVLCFLAGTSLLVILHLSRGGAIEVRDLGEALESESWRKRITALKLIEQKGLEVGNFQAYQRLLRSPHIPERYWLVRALGVSRQSETYEELTDFLDDPHPNVVSVGFYALGQRGETRAIKEILTKIETSNDWYNQWHAYKALRTLGWKQSETPPALKGGASVSDWFPGGMGVSFQDRNPKDASHPRPERRGILAYSRKKSHNS